MLKKIQALFLRGRWRRDEHAWRAWQEVESAIPTRIPESWSETDPPEVMRMAGRVIRIYQHARRGSKALVDFGPAVGIQDTWWEDARPPVGHWVIVHAHLWLPPGTHSEGQVLWVDHWESWASGEVLVQARRHERRMEKEAARQGAAGVRGASPPGSDPGASQPKGASTFSTEPDAELPGDEGERVDVVVRGASPEIAAEAMPSTGPLFQVQGIAVDAGMDEVMATVGEIAAGMGARIYGPAEVDGGRLLSVWPVVGEATFASVTARPMREHGASVSVSVQSLRIEALDMVNDLAEALKSRLGALGPEASPRERMTDYDRNATKRLESEIQDLLEAMAADPSAWEQLSRTVFEREILFQYLTEFRA
ncbi:MAG TPA: hypothetical protein VFU11_09070 [Solirubrobacterales bacterium]|nr:hypothetical protein [Solirubrobacterales bacterium]